MSDAANSSLGFVLGFLLAGGPCGGGGAGCPCRREDVVPAIWDGEAEFTAAGFAAAGAAASISRADADAAAVESITVDGLAVTVVATRGGE